MNPNPTPIVALTHAMTPDQSHTEVDGGMRMGVCHHTSVLPTTMRLHPEGMAAVTIDLGTGTMTLANSDTELVHRAWMHGCAMSILTYCQD